MLLQPLIPSSVNFHRLCVHLLCFHTSWNFLLLKGGKFHIIPPPGIFPSWKPGHTCAYSTPAIKGSSPRPTSTFNPLPPSSPWKYRDRHPCFCLPLMLSVSLWLNPQKGHLRHSLEISASYRRHCTLVPFRSSRTDAGRRDANVMGHGAVWMRLLIRAFIPLVDSPHTLQMGWPPLFLRDFSTSYCFLRNFQPPSWAFSNHLLFLEHFSTTRCWLIEIPIRYFFAKWKFLHVGKIFIIIFNASFLTRILIKIAFFLGKICIFL